MVARLLTALWEMLRTVLAVAFLAAVVAGFWLGVEMVRVSGSVWDGAQAITQLQRDLSAGNRTGAQAAEQSFHRSVAAAGHRDRVWQWGLKVPLLRENLVALEDAGQAMQDFADRGLPALVQADHDASRLRTEGVADLTRNNAFVSRLTAFDESVSQVYPALTPRPMMLPMVRDCVGELRAGLEATQTMRGELPRAARVRS